VQLAGLAAPGDMIIFLGAGDITKWAAGFAQGLKERRGGGAPSPPCRKCAAG
jgi:UDP-N-acetylmuramate--alanine ligase